MEIDNRSIRLGDELKKEIKPGSKVKIAAATFSMFAFQQLKEEFETIEELKFIFTNPTFNEILKIQTNKNDGFNITFEDEGKNRSQKRRKYSGIAKKLDFDKIQKSKNKIGALGEEIVFNFLMELAQQEELDTPIHASKDEGDGLGYDIRYWDKDGKEIHVEVKTTTSSYVEGFEMTRNEIEASMNTNYDYQFIESMIFRLKQKTVKLKYIRVL